MPRNYKRTSDRKLKYDDRLIEQCLEAINNGMGKREASREFNIPRTNINRYMEKNVLKSGGQTIFSEEQENVILKRVFYLCERGFPLSIEDLRRGVYEFGMKLLRRKEISTIPENWHKNKLASLDWWYSFEKRHKNVSLRKPENLSTARAEGFNQKRVRDFFCQMEKIYHEMDIFHHPALIFNCDETGLSSVSNSSKKVIAQKGSRSVQKIQVSERGTLTTLLACINAMGDTIPPFLIFKGTPLPEKDVFPLGTHIATSKSGYIDSSIFLQFLQHLDNYRPKIEDKKCLLILDGHGSHVSYEALEFASEHNIEMACIPPHSSHRLQPLDTHIFGPLKKIWSDELSKYLSSSSKVILTKYDFHKVFNITWKHLINKRGLIVDSFSHCGLFPLKNTTNTDDFKKSTIYVVEDLDEDIQTSMCVTTSNVGEQPMTSTSQQANHDTSLNTNMVACGSANSAITRVMTSPKKQEIKLTISSLNLILRALNVYWKKRDWLVFFKI